MGHNLIFSRHDFLTQNAWHLWDFADMERKNMCMEGMQFKVPPEKNLYSSASQQSEPFVADSRAVN